MEPQRYARQMQEEMIREIEEAQPKYIVSMQMYLSWLGPVRDSERLILNWANDFLKQNYDVRIFVNIATIERTDYYYDELPSSLPRLGNYIVIYERKG
jgi:hypothetical protein